MNPLVLIVGYLVLGGITTAVVEALGEWDKDSPFAAARSPWHTALLWWTWWGVGIVYGVYCLCRLPGRKKRMREKAVKELEKS